jgi:hypothetical protein
MARCPDCESLQGKSADIDPHEQMRGEAHTLRGDGVMELYACRRCGATWERFVATKGFGAQSGAWKTLKAWGEEKPPAKAAPSSRRS